MKKRVKKIVTLFMLMVLLVSNFSSQAANDACSHDFKDRSFLNAYTKTMTHQYIFGVYEDGTAVYKTCTYKQPVLALQKVCIYCKALGDIVEEPNGASYNHSACINR